jgi:hypothetical protein
MFQPSEFSLPEIKGRLNQNSPANRKNQESRGISRPMRGTNLVAARFIGATNKGEKIHGPRHPTLATGRPDTDHHPACAFLSLTRPTATVADNGSEPKK